MIACSKRDADKQTISFPEKGMLGLPSLTGILTLGIKSDIGEKTDEIV